MIKAAVADAKRHGETVGGNVFGIARRPRIPGGTDYVVVQGSDFRIDLPAVRSSRGGFPSTSRLATTRAGRTRTVAGSCAS